MIKRINETNTDPISHFAYLKSKSTPRNVSVSVIDKIFSLMIDSKISYVIIFLPFLKTFFHSFDNAKYTVGFHKKIFFSLKNWLNGFNQTLLKRNL